jgi:hypothetical protein
MDNIIALAWANEYAMRSQEYTDEKTVKLTMARDTRTREKYNK